MKRSLAGVFTGLVVLCSMSQVSAAPPKIAGGKPLPALCPPPSAAECLTSAYQNGFCFEKTKATCAAAYEANYAKTYASSPGDIEPRVVPEQGVTHHAPGSIQPTKIVPYDPASEVSGAPGTYASFMYALRYADGKKGGIPVTAPLTGAAKGALGALAPSANTGAIVPLGPANDFSTVTPKGGTAIKPGGIAHAPLAIADLRSKWEANGNRIRSCEEYTYERFYSFSKFEDEIAAAGYRLGIGHDFRKIFLALVAATPGGVVHARKGVPTGAYSKDADGPKNPFFGRDPATFMQITFYENFVQSTPFAVPGFVPLRFPFDPDFSARITPGLNVGGWGWAMHSAYGPTFLASTIDDEFQRFDSMKESYTSLLKQHNRLAAQIGACFLGQTSWGSDIGPRPAWCDDLVHYSGGGGGPVWTGPGPNEAANLNTLHGEIIVADANLESALEEARAAGCLDGSSPQPCDWSPRDIVNKTLVELRSAEEKTYDECLVFTHGDLTSSDSIITRLVKTPPDDFAGYSPPADPLASTDDFDAMRTAFKRWADNLGYDRDPTTGKIVVGQTSGDKSSTSAGGFGVDLEFGVGWLVDNFSAETSIYGDAPSRGLCDTEAHAAGHAALRATVLDVEGELFAASASVDTVKEQGFAAADVNILGVPFYNPRANGDLAVAIMFEKSSTSTLAEARAIVPVMGIPVTLKAGASGTVGVKGSLTGPGNGQSAIVRDCLSEQQSITLAVKGTFEPFVSVDGYASASIDLGFIEGGIKGELQLARLGLPLEVNVGVGVFAPPPGQGNVPAPATPADIELFVQTALNLDFSTMDGRIAVFLETPFSSSEATLVSWQGLHYRHNVFDRQSHVPLTFLPVIVKL
jgi:hypothetical protein